MPCQPGLTDSGRPLIVCAGGMHERVLSTNSTFLPCPPAKVHTVRPAGNAERHETKRVALVFAEKASA